MPRTTHRTLALLITSSLVLAIVAVAMIPGFGLAQDATPAGDGEMSESELLSTGEGIYNETCIACHQAGGAGAESEESSFTHYPPLAGNPFVTVDDPTAVTNVLLTGRAGMPTFRGMSDDELAGVLTYIRQSWGNDASAVKPEMVTEAREALPKASPQAPATPFPSQMLPVATPAA